MMRLKITGGFFTNAEEARQYHTECFKKQDGRFRTYKI